MSEERVQSLNEFGRDRLPGMIGLEILTCSADGVTGRIPVTPPLIAGTGFLWAPVVIALADTLCAYGTGGTITGNSRGLRNEYPDIAIHSVEEDLNDTIGGMRNQQDPFQPPVADFGLVKDRYVISKTEAEVKVAEIMKEEGYFVGTSAGAVIEAAQRAPQRVLGVADLANLLHLVRRHAHEVGVLAQCLENRLADPPDGVRDELRALGGVVSVGRLDQAHVALVEKVLEG